MARFDIAKYNADMRQAAAPATRTVRRGVTAAEKKLAQLQESGKAQRAKAKREQNQTRQTGMAIGGGLVLGYAAANGHLARVPKIGGLPTTVTVAVVGLVAGEYVGGVAGDALKAIGIASAVAAAYQMGSGQQVLGDTSTPSDDQVQRAVNKLARDIGAEESEVAYHDTPRPTGQFIEV